MRLRPLMKAEDEATFKAYRDRTREGMPRRPIARKKPMPARCSARSRRSAARTCWVRRSELDPGLYYQPRRERRLSVAEDLVACRPDSPLGRGSGAGPVAAAARPAGGRRRDPYRNPFRRVAVPTGLHAGARDRLVRDRDAAWHHRRLCDGALESHRPLCRSMADRADQHAGAGRRSSSPISGSGSTKPPRSLPWQSTNCRMSSS